MRDKIRRLLSAAILIAAAYFLQNGLFTSTFYFGTVPNILLIVTVIYGFLRGSVKGIAAGFVCGILCDLHADSMMGYYTIFYLYAGWFGGLFNRFFYLDELLLPVVLCGGIDFLYGCYMFLFQCVLYNITDFETYLHRIILPEVVYTGVITIIVYHIILFVHDRCTEAEKRSARKFV